MPLSTATLNSLLGLQFGAASYTPPANYQVALFTTTPTDLYAGTGGTEVSGNNYARVTVANNGTNFTTASARLVSNAVAITFPVPSATWGTITAVGLYRADTSAWVGGVALTTARATSSGVAPTFAVGELDFTAA